jgi:WXG100 family type VII secretion target
MRDAAQSLQSSAARISDLIDAVDSDVKALGVERYDSASAEEFRAAYDRAMPRLREAADFLLRFQDKLLSAADDIESATRA